MKIFYSSAMLLAALAFSPLYAQTVGEFLIEDFEGSGHATFANAAGTLTAPAPNTASSLLNQSAHIGDYTTNAGIQYDYCVSNLSGNGEGIAAYVAGTKKFSMKVLTNAPIGTPITLSANNRTRGNGPYPAGRHSVYRAITTQTGIWETLVFNFDNQPDPTTVATTLDQIVFAFGAGNSTFNYKFDDIKGFNVPGSTGPIINRDNLWSNFRNVNKLTYVLSDGALSKAATPSRTGNALSDSVGKYIRSGVQYDVLAYTFNATLTNLPDYTSAAKKFSVKVYSPAIGTTIQFTLQDSSLVRNAYPSGRAMEFVGTTTTANQWEVVTLNYTQSPDPNVSVANINEVAILFNSNTTNPVTIYMDSLYGPQTRVSTPVVTNEYLWSNFRNSNRLTYNHADGSLGKILNTVRLGNNIDSAYQYVRSAAQYDVLAYSWGSTLPALTDYIAGTKKFSFKVLSPAAGTRIQFTLQDSIAVRGAYPTGRAYEFQGTTTTTNQWEKVVFSLAGTPDAGVTLANINQIAILFNSNTTTPINVAMDSLFGPNLGPTAVKPAQELANISCYPNPAHDVVNITFEQTKASAVVVTLVDMNGKVASTITSNSSNAGSKVISLPTANLASGLYLCRIATASGTSVQKVSISH